MYVCVTVHEEILLPSGWVTSVVSAGQEVMQGIKQTHSRIESHATAGQLVLAGVTGIKGNVEGKSLAQEW